MPQHIDYGFMMPTAITRESRRVIVANSGIQPHEMKLALKPGGSIYPGDIADAISPG